MDITNFIISRRETASLAGDYKTYGAQNSRRLHTIRKKLGQTTPKGRKYVAKPPITSENVASNEAYVHLLLISSERAWANAMHMKSLHSTDISSKGIVGATKRHIITRLNKATGYTRQLLVVLQDRAASGATNIDLLEARGYHSMLSGALWMEKRRWEEALRSYSVARVIYNVLGAKVKKDAFRDLIVSTVDPSLRYAAYQMKISRSQPLPSLAIQFFPHDQEIRSEVETVDPASLTEEAGGIRKAADGLVQQLPDKITWRSRTVALEDASIAQALAAASAAESRLSSWLLEPVGTSASPKDKAVAYENVILASQDAVDATKAAIDELTNEGVDRGDPRVQALQVTRTAVNYSLIGWRVGRNRVLCGEHDGLLFETEPSKLPEKSRGKNNAKRSGVEGTGKKLARLRERIALYDSTLQSLDFVQELPGVIGDATFVRELEAKRNYFRALRCLSIGRSHGFLGKSTNTLALYSRALDLVSAVDLSTPSETTATGAPTIDISPEQLRASRTVLRSLVMQYHGVVTLEKLSEPKAGGSSCQPPLIERMDEYAADSLDLSNLVPYPPKMQPIPVKPLFLDVAWNYIDYPRDDQVEPANKDTEERKESRRGWFGFGR
ncbi:hypothetical protein V8E54_010111 [Elaphomyces granulatus]